MFHIIMSKQSFYSHVYEKISNIILTSFRNSLIFFLLNYYIIIDNIKLNNIELLFYNRNDILSKLRRMTNFFNVFNISLKNIYEIIVDD